MKIISTMSLKPEQLDQAKAVRSDLNIEVKKQFTECDAQVEGLLTYGWDVTEQTLELYPNLKWIQAMAAGVDQLPLHAFASKGILLTNVRGAHSIQMSEHVIWCILNLLRQGKTVMYQQEQKVWSAKLKIDEMYGKTVCIVGAGTIGAAVAEKCHAFGMTVWGISQSGKSHLGFDRVAKLEDSEAFLKESDIVVALLPLTSQTKHFFNAERFNQMKDGVYFINVARGSVVDEEALSEALQTGKVQGAALDVFVTEPLPETSPFWSMDQVFLTPHIAGRSPQYTQRMFEVFLKNIKEYPNTSAMINAINLENGY
ncbi:D-2-hydroxyacid dehydrogenase [Desulfitobacterium metallireducens]|uniref:Glyoxylate reductase n=1 Tax=Desulfitobacterium metallireducens DSM 15288 TaxID=871968 RepID=W0EAH2_9FIRM|nr:D-2-hydroxyacid dehydrogenase [Desulfitobacterium metallireducens]AHF06533.1 glyoxylate reductase [Desulfitobacterium metallireducens DSM 15288]